MTTETAPPTMTPVIDGPLFDPGMVVMTIGIRNSGLTAGQLAGLLRRHRLGMWDMDADDTAANMAAIAHGGRVFGSFTIDEHTRVWIITDADRSSTCVLLPSEY